MRAYSDNCLKHKKSEHIPITELCARCEGAGGRWKLFILIQETNMNVKRLLDE